MAPDTFSVIMVILPRRASSCRELAAEGNLLLRVDVAEQPKDLSLWRITGRYANISIFDVGDNDELHKLLSALPLFPFMQMKVTRVWSNRSSFDMLPRCCSFDF
jgi:muconolactone delta-isomerase